MEGLIKEAKKAYKKGLLREARIIYSEILKHNKDFFEIYPDYISVLIDSREYKFAEKFIKEAEGILKEEGSVSLMVSVLRLKARLLKEKGDYEKSKVLLKKLLKEKGISDEEKGRVHFALGRLYFREGDYDTAERHFTESEITFRGTSLWEDEGWSTLWRAKIARIRGEWSRAHDTLKILLREYGTKLPLFFAYLLFEKALLVFEEGKKEEALDMEALLEEHLKQLRAPYLSVEVRLRLSNPLSVDAGEFEKAERRARRALNYIPEEEKILRGLCHVWIGYIRGYWGNLKQAEENYRIAEKLLEDASYEEKGLFYMLKALTYIEFRKKNKAKKFLDILSDQKFSFYTRTLANLLKTF
jgi:tetratricopeptide (TPR) repeat protein